MDPPHNTLVLGKDYEWNDFSTLPQETCMPWPPLTAAQPCTLRYVWGMDWNGRAKFWNGSTAGGGRVCPLECPLAGHTRSCHSWSETNPGHSNKNTLVVQTPPTNIPSALLAIFQHYQMKELSFKSNRIYWSYFEATLWGVSQSLFLQYMSYYEIVYIDWVSTTPCWDKFNHPEIYHIAPCESTAPASESLLIHMTMFCINLWLIGSVCSAVWFDL